MMEEEHESPETGMSGPAVELLPAAVQPASFQQGTSKQPIMDRLAYDW